MATRTAARASVRPVQANAAAPSPPMTAFRACPGHVDGTHWMPWNRLTTPEMFGSCRGDRFWRMAMFHTRHRPAPVMLATATAMSRATRAGTQRSTAAMKVACSDVTSRTWTNTRITAST